MSTGRKITAEQCVDMRNRLFSMQKNSLKPIHPKYPHLEGKDVPAGEGKEEKVPHSLDYKDEPEEFVLDDNMSNKEKYAVTKKAASMGNPEAHCLLGQILKGGLLGIPKDENAGIYHYQQAAAGKNTYAMFCLAMCAKDKTEKVKWLQLGVEHGDNMATYYLAKCYENGEGVPQDITRAIQLYHQHAELGDGWGADGIATKYLEGVGIFPQNEEEAVRWFRRAIEKKAIDASSVSNPLASFYCEKRYKQPPFNNQEPPFSDSIIFNVGAVLAKRTPGRYEIFRQISKDFNELAREKPKVFDVFLRAEPAEKILKIVERLDPELEKAAMSRLLAVLGVERELVEEHLVFDADLSTPIIDHDAVDLIMDYTEPASRLLKK